MKDTNSASEQEKSVGEGVSPQLSPLQVGLYTVTLCDSQYFCIQRPKPSHPVAKSNIRLDAGSSSFISGNSAASLNDSSVLLGESGIEEDFFRYSYSHSQTRRREAGVGLNY